MEKSMKKLVIGILAHVDAGKTTLSESLLFLSGKIAKLGRVDNKNAYLDTYELERERESPFSPSRPFLKWGRPGSPCWIPRTCGFSAELERTLQVLDYAVLVISGADGVQGIPKPCGGCLIYIRSLLFFSSTRWIRTARIRANAP